jgi:O-antigen ligase
MGNSKLMEIQMTESMQFDKIRFALVMILPVCIILELSAAFTVLPALSMLLLAVADKFNLRITVARISGKGYLLTLIFIIHAIWFMWMVITTGSTKYLERTLPFLLFPLMISSTRINEERLKLLFRSFVAAVSASYLMSLVAAAYHYKYSVPRWGRASDFFFHEQFTKGLFDTHPTYYSLLGCVATLLAFASLSGMWRGLAVAFITLVILLINARITLVLQLLLIFSFLLKGFSKGFTLRRLAIFAISGIVLFFVIRGFSSIYDYPHRKILLNLEDAWKRSFAPDIFDGDGGVVTRLAIWRSAVTVIREHPVFGVGVGFEENALVNENEKRHIAFLVNGRLNAHNQILSYLIAMGAIGFTMLGVVYFKLLREAYQKKCLVYLAFIGLFIAVALTESIFNRLLGISLFAFFNALIMLKLVNHDK